MDIDINAKIIWDYLLMKHEVQKADCIIVLGSHDKSVAKRGAELFLAGFSSLLIFSGGLGRLTERLWSKPEAQIFAEIAVNLGVPEEQILIEDKSTNTGENVLFTKQLLLEKGHMPKNVIAVQKPYMERRTFATFKKIWPEMDVIVTSAQVSYEEYCYKFPPKGMNVHDIINIMIGDLHRIKVYYEKDFQIYQEIPQEVWFAFEKLVELGYTKYLISK